jgi:UDP-glucose 4-epimerase
VKVLVTGGNGFIGRHVVDELINRRLTPVVFDRHAAPYIHNPLYDIEVMLGDVRDEVAVTEAAAHVNGVIHLAAVLGTQETIANPKPAAHTNILGALNVFEAVRQYGLPAVYICVGNHWMENTYAISKTAAERFSKMYNNELGSSIAAVRALNAYGPGQSIISPWGDSKVRKIMPTFIAHALNDQPIPIYGDGEQVMDMVYVTDVAKILVDALMAGPHPDGLTYEAGPGVRTSVNVIAEEVLKATGSGAGVEHEPMRPGEPEGSVVLADTSTLEPLGWSRSEFVQLADGVEATVKDIARRIR